MTIAATERLPVLRVRPIDLPKAVIVVGDPDRAERIAASLDDTDELGRYREYVSFRARVDGQTVGVVSHGVGAGGAGICFEELCRGGVERVIRVGTAGGMQSDVRDGDHVVVAGAVRDDGVTKGLVPIEFPALASRHISAALVAAAGERGVAVHEGIALTSAIMYPLNVLGSNLKMWQRAGILAVEQECASLFVIAALHGVQSGAILTIDGNPLAEDDTDMSGYDPHRTLVHEAVDRAAEIAVRVLTNNNVEGRTA